MAIALEVSWAQRFPHQYLSEQITHIGGSSGNFIWSHSSAQAIDSIEQGLFSYYILKNSRPVSFDVGRTMSGEKFLKVCSQDEISTILFNLPESPEVTAMA